MNLKKILTKLAIGARNASGALAQIPSDKKTQILNDVSRELKRASRTICAANAKDIKTAQTMGISLAMRERLTLDPKRVTMMANAVADVAALKDPVGVQLAKWRRPNGLKISKVTVPLGLILIIYESRPNVTSECASLCLKSGNAVLLRGGREAFHSNQVIVEVYQKVFQKHKVPKEAVSLVSVLDRRGVDVLLQMDELINLVIPRGGEALIRRVAKNSRIPVVKHYKGICHVYVDQAADMTTALDIAFNAKCQRTSVCNTMETLLVHEAIALDFLPRIGERLKVAGCEIRGDQAVRKVLPEAKAAREIDWKTEYLDNILSIRVVKNLDEAMKHIQTYGSQHTDAIVTRDQKTAQTFLDQVDSSSVMLNTSTRFSDGNEYGFGAEIGISTDKVHARGPMGLEGLVSYKYVVRGNGQIRT